MIRCKIAGALAGGLAVSAAHAGIVYTLPPQPIAATAVFPDTNPGSNHSAAPLDIDNDGVPEFTINALYERGVFATRGTYLQIERPGVAVRWVEGEGFLPFEAGTLVSASDLFISSEPQLPFFAEVGLSLQGAWEYGEPPAFFGLLVARNGQTHVGWVRAQINFLREPVRAYSVTVFDYAYESEPGVAIVAGAIPSPGSAATLGLAAMVSLACRRRRC